VEIRPAVVADAPRLVPLFEAWDHPQPGVVVERIIAEWDAQARAVILVAEQDGRLIGMAAVVARPGLSSEQPVAHLSGLVVDAAARRAGVGGRLLDVAESHASRWGCSRMDLSSSLAREEAQRFYPARGYHDGTVHHAYYRKPLAGSA
jgi:GNAT superfamily N-acetyltransferase